VKNFLYKYKIFYFLPYLIPLLIFAFFFEKNSSCNDIYFNTDSAEIPQQIGTIFVSYDFVKHPVFYSLSFFLYKILKYIFPITISPEQISHLILIIYQLLFIFSIWRLTFSLKISSKYLYFGLNVFLAISLSTFVVFMPDTYAFSSGILLLSTWYLLFQSPKISSNKYRIIINSSILAISSLTSINLIALSIPYLLTANYKDSFDFQKLILSREFFLRIIEVMFAFCVGLIPFLLVRILGYENFLASYIGKFASIKNYSSIYLWLTSFLNLYVFSYLSPEKYINNNYSPDMILSFRGFLSSLLGISIFLISIKSFLRTIKILRNDNISFNENLNQENLIGLYSFIFPLIQLPFFVYFSPKDSLIFSPYCSFLILIGVVYYIDQNLYLKKQFINYFIFITMLVFVLNSSTLFYSLIKELPIDCRDWGVRQIIIPRE
tara:strand:- start:4967 stop:6271 length:1305 start_codon:yes stop_codon:yes gene_type:complete